jgi:hypothetical protein
MKKKYFCGLLALFIAISCMGVKCQKVTDPGSANLPLPYEDQTFSDRAECVTWCHDHYRPLLLEENRRHEAAMKACGDDKECKQLEAKTHQENVKRIQAERHECVKSCHSQGSVGGGF